MDMSQYLELFIEESKEHLQNLNQNLLELEKDPDNMPILNEIFRVAHTLKGMAGTMGFSKMATLTHDMENVLQEIRNGKIKVDSKIVDVLFRCLDALENYVDNIINTGTEGENAYSNVIKSLNSILETKTSEISDAHFTQADTEVSEAGDESFVLDQYAQNIINKALDMGMNAYKITVKLNKGCVLKSARAFIIFRTLEKSCEVIKSEPKVEDIEDEKFDFEFTVAVVSKESQQSLIQELNGIAEVDEVIIRTLTSKQIPSPQQIIKEEVHSSEDMELESEDAQNTEKLSGQAAKPRTGKTVRVDIDRLDNLMNLVSELIIIKTRLEDIEVTNINQNYGEAVEYLERITTSLHDAVMKVRMVPVEMVFNRFPRMIRDLAKELGKQITLNMYGSETEVDRTVIDEIGDPLIHLLRNSADHGIEMPDIRVSRNKPRNGTINLKAYHDGNNVVIEVQDDGSGIDLDKVKAKAIERGLVNKEIANSLSQKEIIDFLFRPSFSTADKVTDVSGRGVGLDVVKTKIEALGGVIEVETERGKGSKFAIRLPLTLAIIQALMVVLGQEKYAIPLSSIKEIINIKLEEIKLVQKQEVILLRNNVIPLIRLDKVLEVPKNEEKEVKQITVVIVKKGDKLSGFVVDNLIGQQEIVIKSLGKHLSGVKNIAGATILGDGQVALILDVNSLAL
ncbi:MAG: two-component system, chemotaxis family, sensor kinase CheA [Petroclostridium sp.]|jgi:two-component system chemotaxis sensor kinase CheA|uniref:chemotaxis protein CheA n=1 Tax=Petroclostridium xylanilyticum TaxID=1792311 RepID=UPI000B981414|nr:chemotaxis protein CheA [Petroclostridium xylanilyticum]MBZ4645883.1 cheA [Clostridia bacterium]MDK2809317.1 two-component system, chemotaxis family, sensor kinase CheA [Petroclostridium sp.]